MVDKEETDQPTTPKPVHDGDTNPFYGRLPSPGFTDSEEDLECGEASGVCQGCGVTLEPTCERPRTLTIQEFQNYTLAKIVISVCRESFEVKENLSTRKLLRML